MAEVLKLKLVEQAKDSSGKQVMLERFDEYMKKAREYLELSDSGGFAIVAYDCRVAEGVPQVSSFVGTFCTNPVDSYWLPDMVKTRVYQYLHED